MEREYKNTGYFILILLGFVILGFYKQYFALFPHFDNTINTLVQVHASALLTWVGLLIIQPFLIRYSRFKVHRLLGKFSYFLVPLIIVTSVGVINKQYHEGIVQKMTKIESLKTLFIPFTEIVLFSIFYLLAIRNRRKVAFHMRYMICTSVILIIPSLTRISVLWFNINQFTSYLISFIFCDLVLLVLIIFDKKNRLNYKPYVLALMLFLACEGSWYILGHPF